MTFGGKRGVTTPFSPAKPNASNPSSKSQQVARSQPIRSCIAGLREKNSGFEALVQPAEQKYRNSLKRFPALHKNLAIKDRCIYGESHSMKVSETKPKRCLGVLFGFVHFADDEIVFSDGEMREKGVQRYVIAVPLVRDVLQ